MKRFFRVEFVAVFIILLVLGGAIYLHSRTGRTADVSAALETHIQSGIIAWTRSADGDVLASAAQDGTIFLYNERGRALELHKLPEQKDAPTTLTAFALSPAGNEILTADSRGGISLMRGKSRRAVHLGNTSNKKSGGETSRVAGALALGAKFIAVGFENGEVRFTSRNAGAGTDADADAKRARIARDGARRGALRRLLLNSKENLLVSAGDDDLVSVHSLPDGKLISSFRVPGAPVSALRFAAEDRALLIATEGAGLRVYGRGPEGAFKLLASAAQGRGLLSLGEGDGRVAVGTIDGPILVYSFPKDPAELASLPSTLRPRAVLRGHLKAVTLLGYKSDTLVSASLDDTVRLWKKDGTPIDAPYLGHPERVRDIAFAPGGRFIAAALGGNGKENSVWLWTPAGKRIAALRGHEQDVDCVAISPDGRYIASGSSDNTIRITRLGADGSPDPSPASILRDHDRRITRLDFSSDGKYLLSAAGDGTIRLRNPRTGALHSVLRGHRGTVTRAEFSRDGRFILSGGGDRTLRLWKVPGAKTGRAKKDAGPRIFKGHTLGITAAALSPNAELIAGAAWDRTVRVFHVKSGRMKTIELPEREWVIALAFHPRRKLLVGGGWDGGVRFWSFDGREIAHLKNVHAGRVSALAFSPDGDVLATASYDGTIRRHKLDDILK